MDVFKGRAPYKSNQ